MNKRIFISVILMALLPVLSFCGNVLPDKVKTVKLPVGDFHAIEIEGAVRMEYTQSDTRSVEVCGDEKAIEAYSIREEGGKLKVTLLLVYTGWTNEVIPRITVRVAAPHISEIVSDGTSDVVFMGNVKQNVGLDIDVGGACTVSIGTFVAPALNVKADGAVNARLGDVQVSGNVKLCVEGAGNVNGKVTSDLLKLQLDGTAIGKFEINSRQTAVRVSGVSFLTLSGRTGSLKRCGDSTFSVVETDSLKVG